MKGRRSEEFLEVLGYKYVEEIVHREDLVLLDAKDNGGEGLADEDTDQNDAADRDRSNEEEKGDE